MDIESVRRELGRLAGLLKRPDDTLIDYLGAIIHFALLEVPHCVVGVSITVVREGAPYTVTATSPEMRIVDASQYLDDGPCVVTASQGDVSEVPEILSEQRWRVYARAAAAEGVASSLSLPLLFEREIIGALNFYGDTPEAFDDRAHMLAEMISGHASMAMRDADLSFRTAEDAAATRVFAELADAQDAPVEQAVGVLMQFLGIRAGQARERLRTAADQAGVPMAVLAPTLLRLLESEQPSS